MSRSTIASACGSRATLARKPVPRSSIACYSSVQTCRFAATRVGTGIAAVIHLCEGMSIETSMTDIRSAVQPATALAPERTHGDNTPQPVRSLRDWLDHLAARDRLTVVRPGTALRFELAAVAKRLDGRRATLFPRPGGHPIPVVSGLVSDRNWIAEAMGVEPTELLARFQEAALNPIPWREVGAGAVQAVVERDVD